MTKLRRRMPKLYVNLEVSSTIMALTMAQALKQAKSSTDMNKYLTYLCVHTQPISGMDVNDYQYAQSAGIIMLKNNVRATYKTIPEDTRSYIRAHILDGLRDHNAQIRNLAGNVVTEIVKQGGIMAWPQVFSELIAMIGNSDGSVSAETQDGAMGALQKICEDNRKALNKSYGGQKPLDTIVPELINFTSSSNSKVRAKALLTLCAFTASGVPDAIKTNLENILHNLFERANDNDKEVRRYACRLFTCITVSFPAVMIPHMPGIIDYIITQMTDDPSSDLALDAAEFFFENNEKEELQDSFKQHLGKIIPALLECMIWTKEDQGRIESQAQEDAEQEDREQDIAPQFATSKDAIGGSGQNGGLPNGYQIADSDDDSDGEIDDDDGYGDPEEDWNVRKCAASSLDTFSTRFHQDVFQYTLPYLMDNLRHQQWPRREASVLALGAISEGCMESVQPHLPELTPYLLSLLSDPVNVVRQITCWTLGRYCPWATQLDDAGWKQYMEPIMSALLQRMLDKNKGVQRAAVSAFASLEDAVKERLVPYASIIAQTFARCFQTYKDKNIPSLYDCVQTFAESIGEEMAKPEIAGVLMPSIIGRWNVVKDGAWEMISLNECMSYIAQSMKEAFTPYAEPVFARSIKIITDNMEWSQDEDEPPQNKDLLITALDLSSCVIQSLNARVSSQLIGKSQPSLFELLAYAMRDSNNDVRQSAYALLGDAAIHVMDQLKPVLSEILQILADQLDLARLAEDREVTERVLNNACWALGEVAMREPETIKSVINVLFQKTGTILFDDTLQDSLNQNAAIAIGRMGMGNAEAIASSLEVLAQKWLFYMHQVSATEEKQHALQGFTNMVAINPNGLAQCLPGYFAEIAQSKINGLAVPNGFREVMEKYRSMLGGDFDQCMARLSEQQQMVLHGVYTGA